MKNRRDAIRDKGSFELASSKANFEYSVKCIHNAVDKRVPIIIYGPPGTGKTKVVIDLIRQMEQAETLGRSEIIQFHTKFSYEDFIEGFSPSENGFIKKDGVFKKFCQHPSAQDKTDIFLIDEINRAELSTTFGEALFALEDRELRSVTTAHFGDSLKIPLNLALIGTMNTADRNIQNFDFAIRRRFKFIPLFPSEPMLSEWMNRIGFGFSDFSVAQYCSFFSKINSRIRLHPMLGSHMQLGQSMFVPIASETPFPLSALTENFTEAVIAQVEAYFGFGNQRELSLVFNPNIAEKYLANRQINTDEFTALIREVINEQ